MAVLAFVKRHAVLTYYALVFAISWGGLILAVGPGLFSASNWQSDPRFLFVVLAAPLAPGAAGLLLTGLVQGRAGFRDLLARSLRWRVGARWYAVALLTAPLLATAAGLALSLLSPEFLPRILTADDKASLVLIGLAVGLLAGFFEELGWTGFAIPRLRLRYGLLTTGLTLGLL
jgi:CAAX protease family protein